jgi:hypothetical protein
MPIKRLLQLFSRGAISELFLFPNALTKGVPPVFAVPRRRLNGYKILMLLPLWLMSRVLFSMPAQMTDYAVVNRSNEDIKLTVMPKIEIQAGMPVESIGYYKDGKRVLTLSLIECRRIENKVIFVDHDAPAPFFMSLNNTEIILTLLNSSIVGASHLEIIHCLINDLIIYDTQDNVILTYSDITEDSIGDKRTITITQEMVDTGRNKYRGGSTN